MSDEKRAIIRLKLVLWGGNMKENLIYLDTYILQQDMRIRLPKNILGNLSVEKGITKFEIYLDKQENILVLKPEQNEAEIGD